MTRDALIDAMREATGDLHSRKLIGQVLDEAMTHIAERLAAEGRFAWPGFGSFTVRRRAARPGRNPRTGEALTIPASYTVSFRPAAALKARLEGKGG